jgi:hypothetical protein
MAKLKNFSHIFSFLAVFFSAFALNAQVIITQDFNSCPQGVLSLSGCGNPSWKPFAGVPTVVSPQCGNSQELKLPIPKYGNCEGIENVTLGSGVFVEYNFAPGTYKIKYNVCGLANHVTWKFTNTPVPFAGTPVTTCTPLPCANEDFLMPNWTPSNSATVDYISGSVLQLENIITITSNFNKLTFRAYNDPPGQTGSGNSNCGDLYLDNVSIEKLCNPAFKYSVCRVNDNFVISTTSAASNPVNNWQVFALPSNMQVFNGNAGNNTTITVAMSSLPPGTTQLKIVHNVENGAICKSTAEEIFTIPTYPNISALFNITYTQGPSSYGLTASSSQLGVTHAWRVERVSPLTTLCTSTNASITCSGLSYGIQYRVTHTVSSTTDPCYQRISNQIVTYNKFGLAKVETENDLTDSNNEMMKFNNSTKNEHIFNEIKSFPNPSSNNLTIEAISESNGEISISNMLGQVFFQKSIEKGSINFNVETEAFENGMYLLTLKNDGKIVKTEKVVVKH